jgi:large subunit ribosomal protein L4
MIAAAIRGALSDRARNGRLHVVAEFSLGTTPSTKVAANVISTITKRRNVLIVLDRTDDVAYKSLRNLQYVHVLPVDQINAYDVLLSDDVIFTKAAFDAFVGSKTAQEA